LVSGFYTGLVPKKQYGQLWIW